ncbi:MAG TPA: sodium:proton antiporter [Croceibacterium sp.]|jgi:CPA1 family monovalent cation:H+ antiporter
MPPSPYSLATFDIAAIFIVAAAVLGWANYHFLKLPTAIGLTVMGALAAAGLLLANALIPGLTIDDWVTALLARMNFTQTLLQGMLSFLLFAGALHVDLEQLRKDWWPVLLLSTLGVIVSTLLIGAATLGLGLLLHLPIAPLWYFVFGALISPTDPVSVLGVLREEHVPAGLQATVAGESLFNDGVGIVVFTILFDAAITGQDFSLSEGARLFAQEAGGGIAVGLVAGWIGYRAMRSMDDYALEVLATLAVVMGGYAFCSSVHFSGPLAMAVAGLLIGNLGVSYAMSDVTRDYVIRFWALVDDLLNAVLFLLIGLQVIALVPGGLHLALGAAAIVIVLAGRAASLGLLGWLIPPSRRHGRGAFSVLWWGGLRGGISIALALVLPAGPTRELLLAATFGAVLFSVLVQRATLGRVIERGPLGALLNQEPPTVH